jgi:adenylosuccinate lyase
MSGLELHPAVIAKNVERELPFLATENLLMAAVATGGDRQDLHERIRKCSMAAAAQLKSGSMDNPLINLLKSDPAFAQIDFGLDPMLYVGRAPEQVTEFISEVIQPIREQNLELLDQKPHVEL